jgi:hypothetical protein
MRSRIDHVIKGLNDFAETVGRAERPTDVWVPHPSSLFRGLYFVKSGGRTVRCHGASVALDEIDDSNTARRQLCLMLDELGRWMLDVAARGKPVTILGI